VSFLEVGVTLLLILFSTTVVAIVVMGWGIVKSELFWGIGGLLGATAMIILMLKQR